MKCLLFALLALPLVLADDGDVTQLCLANQFQSNVYDFNNRDVGIAACDFIKNLTVLTFQKANYRLIFDLTAMKGYLIANESACVNFDMEPSQAIFQCLPANARSITNTTTKLGLDPNSLEIKAFEVPIEADVAVRVAITSSKPAFPVLRQIIGTQSRFSGNVLLFTNSETVIDPRLFVFPLTCPQVTKK